MKLTASKDAINLVAWFILIFIYIYTEVGSSVLHVAVATFSAAVAALIFWQCTGSGSAC